MAQLRDLFAREYPNYLRDLEMLVNIDSGTFNKPGVDLVVIHLKAIAQRCGASVIDYAQGSYGNCIYVRLTGRGRAKIFLMGHSDTVYPDGTASHFPFRRGNGHIYGPGANDMKAGLLAGLYAIKALGDAGIDNFAEIGMFVNSEEEISSPVSRRIFPALAGGADAGLVLEAGRENGDIVSARKGAGTYTIRVTGHSAHAGVEPEKGANAVLALARYVVDIAQMNLMRDGLTVNTGIISGGTRPNVVPDLAEAEVDLRVLRADDALAFENQLREILARQVVPGTRASFTGGVGNPPMEKTAASALLAEWARTASQENGFTVRDVLTGGASDGNIIAGEGVPVLDGLGPVGGHDHNAAEEYVLEGSIIPRVAMLARLIQLIADHREELERPG